VAENVASLEHLADRVAEAERRRARVAPVPSLPVRGVRLRSVDELLANPQPVDWLVRRWIERGTLAQWIGAPGSAKSFGAGELGCCVGTGTEFFGYPVARGPVVYLAGEGHAGIARRMRAWSQERGISLAGAPIYVSDASFAANHVADAEPVASEIRRVEAAHGPIALVIFDTLARHMAGDENEAAEVAALFACVDNFLRGSSSAAVLMVHHVGHHARDRARGSSAFRAAVDHEALFVKDGKHVEVRVTKSKDAEEPPPLHLELVGVTLDDWPRGEDGEPVTSAVLRPAGVPAPADTRAVPRGANQSRIVDCLRRMLAENAERLASSGIVDGIPRVTVEALRKRTELPRARWHEAFEALRDAGAIRVSGPYVELVGESPAATSEGAE
jgi:hypothetical protein